MSDLMRLIPFKNIIEWSKGEFEQQGSVFGIRKEKFYVNKSGTFIEMFGEKITSPVGPAAGPNSQLSQNIIASYLAGCRFMELKTVQEMDGEALRSCVAKPCINAEDEGYNVEWSTELTVQEAYDEYVKAWFAIHVLAKEFGISDVRDFAYNMSVGYSLDDIKKEKTNTYIENMKDASKTPIWNECYSYLEENIDQFDKFTMDDLKAIDTKVCASITLSTLHGCPPAEIERIASYLIDEKGIHTYIKCNPTLLGYEFARKIMDDMGYDYMVFDDHHFKADLQWADGVALINRVSALATSKGLEFGVKLTNTFPVKIDNKELPIGDPENPEMYMSGRSLFPLTISLANKLTQEFKGKLPISYSGGADFFNIEDIIKTGIKPITVATTILKPGGYERVTQLAEVCEKHLDGKFAGVDVDGLNAYASDVRNNKYHVKDFRPVGSRKTDSKLELFDCFKAPCKDGGCPINQQIPEYLDLVGKNKFEEAFKVIATDNATPGVLGTICDHQCQNKCTRLDYDTALPIRSAKSMAVENAMDGFIKNIKVAPLRTNKKAYIIGAGPAGIATALFLRRNGVEVVVVDKRSKPFGIVSHTIPEFRVSTPTIERDYQMAVATGVEFKFNVDGNYNIAQLKEAYDFVVVATGAWGAGKSPVKEGFENMRDALEFLGDSKANDCKISIGKNVAVIGGGDVAMDCARAAKRAPGVENVSIVYRRTKGFMPAEPEEIKDAIADGVNFQELLGPVSYTNGKLKVEVMKLGERDANGRKAVTGTGEFKELDFDTVVCAVGAQVETDLFKSNGFELNKWDLMEKNYFNETSIENVYVAGDCKEGPSTIVRAVADGKKIAKDILGKLGLTNDFVKHEMTRDMKELEAKKGVLADSSTKGRCLVCDQKCELCTDVCPNRANVSIYVNGFGNNDKQIVHLDGMCNECGNCGIFCPHDGNPYKDKITYFWTLEDFEDSTNKGFLPTGRDTFKVRKEDGTVVDYVLGQKGVVSTAFETVLKTIIEDYKYYNLSL